MGLTTTTTTDGMGDGDNRHNDNNDDGDDGGNVDQAIYDKNDNHIDTLIHIMEIVKQLDILKSDKILIMHTGKHEYNIMRLKGISTAPSNIMKQ